MTSARLAPYTLMLAALLGGASSAPAQTVAECSKVLSAFSPGVAPGNDPCLTLAVFVATTSPTVARVAEAILKPDAVPVGAVFSQRDMQPRHTQQAATGGTPAQGQAIPDVKPAGVAAGTIAAVGTDAGTDAIAALSVNPAILFLGDEVTKAVARYSRFVDLTMFVPVSGLPSATTTPTATERSTVEYFGARIRVNVHGLSAGDSVWNRARELLLNRIARAGRNAQHVRTAFSRATDLGGCVTALMADPPVAATTVATCGGPLTLEVDLAEAEELRSELTQVRRAADSKYFGADIRFDVGDPTLGAVENAKGKFLFAGLSFGRRLGAGAAGTYGFRGRLGLRHSTLDVQSTSEFAVEGGAGFDLARPTDDQEINAAIALEFRKGDAAANLTDVFQTDFVMLRGSVEIPITSANSFSINFGAPISGDVSPILSVNFNWGLLLSNALRR
jgi:hypothetical protein